MNINPYTGAARQLYHRRTTERDSATHVPTNPVLTGYHFPAAVYRPTFRNTLGPCVSWYTYLSCLDGKASIATAHHYPTSTDLDKYYQEAGYYGMVCATFLANAFGSKLWLSTTTAWEHYKDKMERITDLSLCQVGDVIYWYGGMSKQSNHAAIVVDRIFVDGFLRYVVIAEAASAGVQYSCYTAPFTADKSTTYTEGGEEVTYIRPAYVLRSGDFGFTPPRISETDVWVEGEAQLLVGNTDQFDQNYAGGVPLLRTLPSTLTMRSSWGDRHNTRFRNEQRIAFAWTADGTPYDTIALWKQDADGGYTISKGSWLLTAIKADENAHFNEMPDGDNPVWAYFSADYVLAPGGNPVGEGWYRLIASGVGVEDAVCDLYYYEPRVVYVKSGNMARMDIKAIVDAFGMEKVLVSHRVFDPEGAPGRAAQFAYVPLADYVQTGAYDSDTGILTTTTYTEGTGTRLTDQGLVAFNAYGAAEYVFTEVTP